MITNNFSSQDGVSNLVERNGENKSETNDYYSHDIISFLTSSSDGTCTLSGIYES